MSEAVTELTARRLRAIVAREQAAARVPSLVAGVVRDGELVWSDHHGEIASAASGAGTVRPGVDTQYRIGSITKTMTAVLVLQLRDEGRLGLDDRLDRHLPGVGYGDRRIRELLAHSSGMQSEPSGSWWERSPGVGFEELAAAIDEKQAAFEPGATYHYTNLAYGLLGEVVARHRGGTWWEQVRTRILEPLGMSRTSYDAQEPAADGYSVHQFANTLTPEPTPDTGAMAPAGQLWSTIDDLARYAWFLVDGHSDVLSRATLREMCTPQSGSLVGGLEAGYGLGLRLLTGGSGMLVGHTGSMPGFVAGLFTDPVRRTAAVCLANGTTGVRVEGMPRELLETLEELEPTVPEAWTPSVGVPDRIAELLGVWHWGNTAYAFSLVDGEIQAATLHNGAVVHRFLPQPDGTLLGVAGYHHGETLRVVRNEDGSINHLVCATFVYTRTPYDPAAPIPGGAPAAE